MAYAADAASPFLSISSRFASRPQGASCGEVGEDFATRAFARNPQTQDASSDRGVSHGVRSCECVQAARKDTPRRRRRGHLECDSHTLLGPCASAG